MTERRPNPRPTQRLSHNPGVDGTPRPTQNTEEAATCVYLAYTTGNFLGPIYIYVSPVVFNRAPGVFELSLQKPATCPCGRREKQVAPFSCVSQSSQQCQWPSCAPTEHDAACRYRLRNSNGYLTAALSYGYHEALRQLPSGLKAAAIRP